jgi:hypothetical protein
VVRPAGRSPAALGVADAQPGSAGRADPGRGWVAVHGAAPLRRRRGRGGREARPSRAPTSPAISSKGRRRGPGSRQPQRGQPVHDRPGQEGDGLGVGAGRPALGLDVADPGQQEAKVRRRPRQAGRRVEQVAPPHHREVGRVATRSRVGPPAPEPLAGGRARPAWRSLGDGRPSSRKPSVAMAVNRAALSGKWLAGAAWDTRAAGPATAGSPPTAPPGDQLQRRLQQLPAQVAAV